LSERLATYCWENLTTWESQMKAIVQDRYGSPDAVPQLKEIDRPVARDEEVLVRVRAATARWAWDIPAGIRYIGRIGEIINRIRG
jgi:hypothetical protein